MDPTMELLFRRVPESIPLLLENCKDLNRLDNKYTQAARRLGEAPYRLWLEDAPAETNKGAWFFNAKVTGDEAMEHMWFVWSLLEWGKPLNEEDWYAVVGYYLSIVLRQPPR